MKSKVWKPTDRHNEYHVPSDETDRTLRIHVYFPFFCDSNLLVQKVKNVRYMTEMTFCCMVGAVTGQTNADSIPTRNNLLCDLKYHKCCLKHTHNTKEWRIKNFSSDHWISKLHSYCVDKDHICYSYSWN